MSEDKGLMNQSQRETIRPTKEGGRCDESSIHRAFALNADILNLASANAGGRQPDYCAWFQMVQGSSNDRCAR
jgi:hypothetical protein